MPDRYDHLCSEPECCSYKQRGTRGCGCHKTRETMMLERIAELEEQVDDLEAVRTSAVRITREIADMARSRETVR